MYAKQATCEARKEQVVNKQEWWPLLRHRTTVRLKCQQVNKSEDEKNPEKGSRGEVKNKRKYIWFSL